LPERIANAGESEVEITLEMIEAGVVAADLVGFRWGWDCEESLVSRVYQAMDAVRRGK
jgi:hypothetical protein